MSLAVLLILTAWPAIAGAQLINLGCWGDTGDRAIPTLEGLDPRLDGSYRARSNAIEKCKLAAADRGWTVIAIQHSGWCASSATAGDTYKKYGPSTSCGGDGEGGPWANQVYQIGVITCTDEFGNESNGGDSYIDDNGKTCTCNQEGITCLCEGDEMSCSAGSYKWTDQDTCEASCIRNPAYCSSSGDPHYRTFDGKYYDFHGQCTYQAASCGDFVVNFKNIDFLNRAPRYTKRVELVFKGMTLAISNGYSATVNGQVVQVPYIKTYTNGDKVEILNNGQLEIRLYQYSKGRNPAVRLRASNAGQYVNAEMWLHGSCADITEGLCGNWNENSGDDLTGGSANSLGDIHQQYDEDCPAPPDPYHPCDDVTNGHTEAASICNDLLAAPFSSCHSSVDVGNDEGGVYYNCMTDVCNCFLDQNCACSQYDTYASTCIDAGVDLSNWRHSVEYCPYDCPEGQVYKAAGAIPAPTCLDKDPEEESTARGCFCPDGQYLQDNVCVNASLCRCLYEGSFYNSLEEITKEGECQTCSCQDAGEMACQDLQCPALTCADVEIEAVKDDICCPYCDDSWVVALNPHITIKGGQDVVLTCEVNAEGVRKRDISWYKDGLEITDDVSNNKLTLKISDADADDDGTYVCSAETDGKVGEATFDVEVVTPEVSDIIIKPTKTNVSCKQKTKGCKLKFKITKTSGDEISKKGIQICKLVDGKTVKCKKAKGKKGTYRTSLGKNVSVGDSGVYVCVVTENGEETISSPVTVEVKGK